MVLRAGWTESDGFDQQSDQGHSHYGHDQRQRHGEAGGEECAEEHHAPQRNKINLREVDDPHGVVDHTKPKGDKRVYRSAGQSGKDKLRKIIHRNGVIK